MKIFQGNTF